MRYLSTVFGHHLSGNFNQLIIVRGSGFKAHAGLAVIGGNFVAIAQYQHGYVGLASVQFCNEGRSAKSRAVMARDYQAQTAGEIRLFDKAKCFCRIRHANYVTKALFERRHPYERL